jgi:hypothetical protein
VVHGIGTTQEWQKININDFTRTLNKVMSRKFKNSNYEFVIKMVEWNSLVNNE